MAKSLEDTLRGLAKRGELTYFSLIPVEGGFEATFAPASTFGHNFVTHPDPVEAALAAINGFGPLRKRKPDIDPEVTALLS